MHIRPEDKGLYKGVYDQGWAKIRTRRLEKMKELGIVTGQTPLTPPYPTVPDWEQLTEEERREWAGLMELYAAVMHRLDLGIGKVVRTLREQDQLDNTLILFLSDNGACQEDPIGPWISYPNDGEPGGPYSFPAYELPWANVSNTPYRLFKSFLHEGGVRTPFIAHWPEQIKGGTINGNEVGHIIDIMPTLLELAGADYPAQIGQRTITPAPGQSLSEVITAGAHLGPRTLFWEHQYNRTVREGDWKLLYTNRLPGIKQKGEWELYNLESDPLEMDNLAEKYPEKVQSMSLKYQEWADAIGAYDKATFKELTSKK